MGGFARLGVVTVALLALLAGSALARSHTPGRRAAPEPTPTAADWTATAVGLRGQDGSSRVYVCPAAGRLDQVWGTAIYSDNSSVCTAAVHRGSITAADGGIVTIEHLAGQASYAGSVANGVTSVNLGAWPGSFQVIGADKGGGAAGVKMGGASWLANATTYRGQNGTRYRYICPGGGRVQGISGTNTYTDDSSVCSAAVHVGLLTPVNGGQVTIEMRPGQSAYTSTTSNGLRSSPHGAWPASFVLVGAAQIPPGGGGGTTTTGGGGSAAPPTATATGTVLVNGRPFTTGTIPYGATVDVTNGRLLLTADTGRVTLSGRGVSASFKLLRGTDRKKPIVEMRLVKGNFAVCPKRTKSSVSRTAATIVRQLWADGKGQFRTRGRYASATVRGTNWLTADRCDGTNVKVVRGVIGVNDVPKRRQVTVRAPRSYLATP